MHYDIRQTRLVFECHEHNPTCSSGSLATNHHTGRPDYGSIVRILQINRTHKTPDFETFSQQ
jgi:hypothetical protein